MRGGIKEKKKPKTKKRLKNKLLFCCSTHTCTAHTHTRHDKKQLRQQKIKVLCDQHKNRINIIIMCIHMYRRGTKKNIPVSFLIIIFCLNMRFRMNIDYVIRSKSNTHTHARSLFLCVKQLFLCFSFFFSVSNGFLFCILFNERTLFYNIGTILYKI